jgi:2,3-dihydroxybenzoate decarboxylase
MKHDYTYYWTHNVSITTSGNYNTRGLKFCIDEIGFDRCLYAIGGSSPTTLDLMLNE